jgi:hypothetical protein
MHIQEKEFLESAKKQFAYYKLLGDKCLERLNETQLQQVLNDNSNSMVMIVQHLHGNMMSRWTDFLTTDGEKETRNRDMEFEILPQTKTSVLSMWNEGWSCLFHALDALEGQSLSQLIYIRNQGHTVMEAINRQLAHYPYHVGQMVFLAKVLSTSEWESLSIPKNASGSYNAEKFAKEKSKGHFTDEYLKGQKPTE